MTDSTSDARTDLGVGAVVTPLRRRAGLHAWNRFAAVNDEFVDIHMDDEAGRAAGYPAAIGMGNLLWSWLHVTLELWLDGRGEIEHLECRFAAPALRGDMITCSGTVTDRRSVDETVVLDVDMWADDGDGTRLAPATARIRLCAGH